MKKAETNMQMEYELITPNIAQKYLDKNTENRRVSPHLVETYAMDMKNGRWDEQTGQAISFDENGILRDGQHRLLAVIKADTPIRFWVCRSASKNGIYDNNRKRSLSDQISIIAHELENVYHSTRYTGTARAIIGRFSQRVVSPNELVDFTRNNKNALDGYWLNINKCNTTRFGITTIHVSMFLAYLNGVSMDRISHFFEVLRSGMSASEEDFPILAYRNYVLSENRNGSIHPTIEEVSKCQYALKSYLAKNKTKRVRGFKELIYPINGLNY